VEFVNSPEYKERLKQPSGKIGQEKRGDLVEKTEWSPWFKLDVKTVSEKAPDRPSVYRIRQEKGIERLSGKRSNLIYIGGTKERRERKSLKHRLLDIFEWKHTADECIIQLIDAGRNLEFSFIETDFPDAKERELKRKYGAEYWELPPCNRSR
jgi:hypothetical protein